MNPYEIIKYKNEFIELDICVSKNKETLWLTKEDMALLFSRDRSVIARHISKIITKERLEIDRVCAKNARTGPDGKSYIVDYYNLDVVLAVGYRVKSQNGLKLKEWLENNISEKSRNHCF